MSWYVPCGNYKNCKHYENRCFNCTRNKFLHDNFEIKEFVYPTEIINTSTTPKTTTYTINSFDVENVLDSFDINEIIKFATTPRAIKVTSEQWELVKLYANNDLKFDANMECRLYGVPIYIDDTIEGDYKFIW